MVNILVTGFEPFGNWSVNPTAVAAMELDGQHIVGFDIVGKVLPLRYHEIKSTLTTLVEEYHPKSIVLSGQAGGTSIRLERIAQNKSNSKIPYNCGTITDEEILEKDGPTMIKTSLPMIEIYRSLQDENIPVTYSDNAGAFGCNQVFYHARHDFHEIPSGFIHVPLLPIQVTEGDEFMEQEIITRALYLSLDQVAKYIGDHR